jgi:methionyl-tRNA formyltransferase
MSHSLRVVFAGTPEFAAAALAAIHQAGFAVPLVLTQPDRPAGRGMKLQASAVKRYAQEHGLAVAQPPSLRRNGKFPAEAAAAIDLLRATPHDVMVVAAYGLLLPQEVLDIPPHGCITLMQMDAGLDTGPMIAETHTAIRDDDTTATLHDKLADAGAQLIVEALATLERDGKLSATPQPEDGTTYAEKIGKQEAALDWRRTAAELARLVRAFDPFPGGVATIDGTQLKIWSATAVPSPRAAAVQPGTIVDVSPEGVVVGCGDGALRVTQLQKPGGKRLPAREFLMGSTLAVGQRFDLPREAGQD